MSILASRPNLNTALLVFPVDKAVAALCRELRSLGYNETIIGEIAAVAHDTEELATAFDLGMIDDPDYAHLSEVFASAFPAVHPSSTDWYDRGVWTTSHPTPDESRTFAAMVGSYDAPDAPLTDPEPDDDGRWLEFAAWSAMSDPTSPPDLLECEWTEVGARSR